MKKTSLKQQLLLIIFGVCLAVIFLEISLRIAGGIVFYLQQRHNHVSFNRNEYRILCLGESTTALGGEDAYPIQLEAMLNAQNRQIKFTVINEGIVSTTTDYILAHLDQNLDKYKPQMVIVMMGINDRVYLHGPYKTLWWENIKLYLQDFRVYKLAHLLYERITHQNRQVNVLVHKDDSSYGDDGTYQEVENFLEVLITKDIQRFHDHMSQEYQYRQNRQLGEAQQEDQFAQESLKEANAACVELAKRYRLRGLYQEAEEVLERTVVFNVDYQDIYQEWGQLYLAQGKSGQAVKSFQAALLLDPKNSDVLLGLARAYHQEGDDNAFLVYTAYLQKQPQDYWGYIELAQWLKEDKHYDLAREYLSHAIELAPYFDQAYVDLGQILDDQGQYQNEEAFYLKEVSLHPDRARLIQTLGEFYEQRGRDDLAQGYFQKEAQQEMSEYLPVTLVNYKLFLDKILSRRIKVVVMQYPVRSIGPLKDYLGQRNGVVFVENRQNFKQALKSGEYSQYFKDNFALDFGHCTRRGNQLIAHNLLGVVLKNE